MLLLIPVDVESAGVSGDDDDDVVVVVLDRFILSGCFVFIDPIGTGRGLMTRGPGGAPLRPPLFSPDPVVDDDDGGGGGGFGCRPP